MKTWTRSFVLIAILITIVKTTTAQAHSKTTTIVNTTTPEAHSKTCEITTCKRTPMCSSGYNSIYQTHDGCSSSKAKKYCCRNSKEPQCVVTECSRQPSCPQNHRELERTKNGCPFETVKAYCCKATDLPLCFAMDYPDKRVIYAPCPADYIEKGRYNGSHWLAHRAERIACCRAGFDKFNYKKYPFVFRNVSSSDAEYFTILFSNSQSLYAQFFKILLTVPALVSLFKCTSISLW